MKPNNKSNHTDPWSGKRTLIKGGVTKDRSVFEKHELNDEWLESHDWDKQKNYSLSVMKKHLKKYDRVGVRRNYVSVDKRFLDDPELFRKYLERIINEQ